MCAAITDFNVSLYLYEKFLEMLYYGTVDCTPEVGVLICDDTGFVADAIIYILTVAQLHAWVLIKNPEQEDPHTWRPPSPRN
jgi:hypothetical protein